jgi:hypothetical protein
MTIIEAINCLANMGMKYGTDLQLQSLNGKPVHFGLWLKDPKMGLAGKKTVYVTGLSRENGLIPEDPLPVSKTGKR